MKKLVIFTGIILSFTISPYAQSADTTQAVQKKSTAKTKKQQVTPVYYGGSIGLSFGDYFRISVAPFIGYKLTRDASVGVKVAYEYIRDTRYSETLTSSNYGGSVFTRYRFHPKAYAHAEFAYMSYKFNISNFDSDREWVPFILLGGGFMQPISKNSVFMVEVLFDVLQDDKSPYEKWNPWVSVGVGIGL
jgi:hypothetical protein